MWSMTGASSDAKSFLEKENKKIFQPLFAFSAENKMH